MKRFLDHFFVMGIALLALTGCSREFTLNVAQFTAGLSTLDAQYEQVATVIVNRDDMFTDIESDRLKRADEHFQRLRQSAHALIADSGGVTQAVIKADQVRTLYNIARSTYLSVRSVICPITALEDPVTVENCPRLELMEPYEQQMLIDFDQNAQRTRAALEGILNSPSGTDVTQAVSDVLTIGATAARIARLGAL